VPDDADPPRDRDHQPDHQQPTDQLIARLRSEARDDQHDGDDPREQEHERSAGERLRRGRTAHQRPRRQAGSGQDEW
jgi:hypothetical protein